MQNRLYRSNSALNVPCSAYTLKKIYSHGINEDIPRDSDASSNGCIDFSSRFGDVPSSYSFSTPILYIN
ncbi:hypothetical protein BpHYR1_022756 [Brachionus plicatilis]|uniref:Uncharacterized protein n=1 Tax=Brachionus plicatilis TaxID=10195 RepID=A0A3M7TAM3_BRAPC|nr:hypothetical protein BpHYR1_022756 [Brachionus plicatilis]